MMVRKPMKRRMLRASLSFFPRAAWARLPRGLLAPRSSPRDPIGAGEDGPGLSEWCSLIIFFPGWTPGLNGRAKPLRWEYTDVPFHSPEADHFKQTEPPRGRVDTGLGLSSR